MKKKKQKITFVCQECGYSSPKWLGKCPNCDAWNSFIEERSVAYSHSERGIHSKPVRLSEIEGTEQKRWISEISEFDRVLGGGIVPGTIILVGGEPGVGKSTLLIEVASKHALQGKRILYVSGEESPYQIGLRAKRLGIETEDLFLLSETAVETLLKTGAP